MALDNRGLWFTLVLPSFVCMCAIVCCCLIVTLLFCNFVLQRHFHKQHPAQLRYYTGCGALASQRKISPLRVRSRSRPNGSWNLLNSVWPWRRRTKLGIIIIIIIRRRRLPFWASSVPSLIPSFFAMGDLHGIILGTSSSGGFWPRWNRTGSSKRPWRNSFKV